MGDEDSEKRLGAYQNMRTGVDDIKPEFLEDDKKKEANNEAAEGLKNAEDVASEKMDKASDGLAGVREKEESGGFTSNVTGRGVDKKDKKKTGIKGILKKRGPIGLIIGLIFGGGALIGGAQMFMPFSLLAQFTETFNSMHTSVNLRSNVLFRTQMNGGNVKNPIKANLFGGDTYRAPSSKQQARLAAQGIEYDGDYDGYRVLKFDDGSGNIKIVTADADTAAKIGGGAVDFRTLYAENSAFFNGYNKGSMTWRGAISNWFGTVTVKFLRSNKITRNMFQDFQKKVAAVQDGNAEFVAKQIMAKGAENVEDGGMRVRDVEEEADGKVKMEDGKLVSTVENAGGGTIKRSELANYEAAKSRIDKIGGTVQKGANVACTLMNVAGAISLLVVANEAIQIINLVTGYFEAIDKVKAGNGDESPINEFSNALVTPVQSDSVIVESTGVAVDDNDIANNYNGETIKTIKDEKVLYNGTAMESSGIASFYGGGKVNPNDPSVRSFNLTNSFKSIFGGIGVSMTAFSACAITKVASNITTAVVSFLDVAACIAGLLGAPFTLGGSAVTCGLVVKDVLKGIGRSIAIGVAVAGLIAIITPIATNMLTRDLISNLGGEDLGNALTYGANMYLGNSHRANGGSLASIDKYREFAIEQQSVIAENAKYERQTRDPFDITSKYTFMGTLMTQMMSFSRANSLTSALASSGSVIASSISSLNPTTFAYELSQNLPSSMEEYNEVCPYLASIGAVGDVFCNPYAITDVSTINEDPNTVIKILQDRGNFKMNGGELDTVVVGKDESGDITNVVIDADSDLAKYILFCDNRTSAFGLADNNIVNQVSSWGAIQTNSSFVNTFANSAMGAVPVIGDVIDVVSNEQALGNIGYVSGESCVAGHENHEDRNSPDWATAKYYQRFIEDQSLAESMGLIEESAVTAFLNDYYEKNPLDNSYEGILARYSGLEKDTVIALLDVIEYGNYIANYHPEERYYFGEPKTEYKEVIFDNENTMASEYLPVAEIIYADVRNRSFVV